MTKRSGSAILAIVIVPAVLFFMSAPEAFSTSIRPPPPLCSTLMLVL
jgi:hypothetical protein